MVEWWPAVPLLQNEDISNLFHAINNALHNTAQSRKFCRRENVRKTWDFQRLYEHFQQNIPDAKFSRIDGISAECMKIFVKFSVRFSQIIRRSESGFIIPLTVLSLTHKFFTRVVNYRVFREARGTCREPFEIPENSEKSKKSSLHCYTSEPTPCTFTGPLKHLQTLWYTRK